MIVRLLSFDAYLAEAIDSTNRRSREQSAAQIKAGYQFETKALINGISEWPPFEMTPTWVNENIKGKFKPLIVVGNVFFEREDDALMVYLTWY